MCRQDCRKSYSLILEVALSSTGSEISPVSRPQDFRVESVAVQKSLQICYTCLNCKALGHLRPSINILFLTGTVRPRLFYGAVSGKDIFCL